MEVLEQSSELFREFHSFPELSNKEYQTTNRIQQVLKELDIELLDLPLKTGVVARITGKRGGPTIAIRGDIDALPITEETGLSYQSQNIGVMHACGHDVHICTVLEVAARLKRKQEQLVGTVILIFQPAEETAFGAKQIIKTNILKKIDRIVSMHCNPTMEVGTIGINKGSITASVDIMKLRIKGQGAHGAKPENSRDSIVAAASLISTLQSVVSRNVSPTKSAVVSITHIEGGTSYNILPASVYLEGTIRTTDKEIRKLVEERVKKIIAANDLAYAVNTEVEWIQGPPATDNDEEIADLAWKIAKELGYQPIVPEISMVGEDFAFYQEECKGLMAWIGVGMGEELHSSRFQAEIGAITVAADFFEQLMLQYLQ